MHKAILVGALFLAAGSVAAFPASNIVATGVGPLDMIVAKLGYTPDTLPITTYGPDGPVTRTATFREVSDALALTAAGGSTDGPIPASRCTLLGGVGIYCGPDVGAGTLNAGPFCDNSSGWIAHSGSVGSGFTILDDPKPTSVVTCGGFFGPTFDWGEVQLTPDASTLSYEGCYATTWTIHSNGYCPNPFTPADTFLLNWRATGTGVALSLAGFDYFLGNGASNSYDLPPGVIGV